MLADDRSVDRRQLGARVVDGRPRCQTAEELGHPMRPVRHHQRAEVVRARHHVGDDLGGHRVRHRRLEHADDGRRPRAKADPLADDRRIAGERRRPEAIGQHRRAGRLRSSIACVEQTAEHRTKAHHVEVRSADDAGLDDARLAAEADQREVDGGEVAERSDRLDARLEVVHLRYRERRVLRADTGCALADVDQPIFVAIDERTEQHAAHDAEDGGVGADAERERHDDGQRQAFRARERADRKLQIVRHRHTVPRERTPMRARPKMGPIAIG